MICDGDCSRTAIVATSSIRSSSAATMRRTRDIITGFLVRQLRLSSNIPATSSKFPQRRRRLRHLLLPGVVFFVFGMLTVEAQSAISPIIPQYGGDVIVEPVNCTNVTGTMTLALLLPFNGTIGFNSNAAAATLAIGRAHSDGLISCWRIQ